MKHRELLNHTIERAKPIVRQIADNIFIRPTDSEDDKNRKKRRIIFLGITGAGLAALVGFSAALLSYKPDNANNPLTSPLGGPLPRPTLILPTATRNMNEIVYCGDKSGDLGITTLDGLEIFCEFAKQDTQGNKCDLNLPSPAYFGHPIINGKPSDDPDRCKPLTYLDVPLTPVPTYAGVVEHPEGLSTTSTGTPSSTVESNNGNQQTGIPCGSQPGEVGETNKRVKMGKIYGWAACVVPAADCKNPDGTPLSGIPIWMFQPDKASEPSCTVLSLGDLAGK